MWRELTLILYNLDVLLLRLETLYDEHELNIIEMDKRLLAFQHMVLRPQSQFQELLNQELIEHIHSHE